MRHGETWEAGSMNKSGQGKGKTSEGAPNSTGNEPQVKTDRVILDSPLRPGPRPPCSPRFCRSAEKRTPDVEARETRSARPRVAPK